MKINISSIVQAKTIDKAIGGSIDGGGLKPTSVTIKSNPAKTKYAQGEALDITGLKVEATVGELSGDVTADVTTVPANGTILTNQTKIDVKYGGVTQSIPIEVVTISSIEVTSNPTVTNYFIGSQLDLSGIVVTGTYSDGSTSNITNLCTFTPASGTVLDKLGQNEITVSYNGLSDSISVAVYEADSIAVTKQPTKTTYKTDEPLDFTGLIVTGSNSGAGLSADVTSACTFSPAEGTTLDEEKTYTISVSYGSLSTSFDVVCQNLPTWDSRGLNYNSWDTIQAYAQVGKLGNVANEGDTKEITVGAETITMKLASINDGTGAAGQYYPNGTADFISVELLPDLHVMNSRFTTVGGWNDCEMRTYLNGTVYPTLPSDLKSVIVEKTHMRTAGNQSTSLVSASDKLWLPTDWEIFGDYNSGRAEDAGHNNHYTIFPDNASRIKYRKAAPTSASSWWLSSPYVNDTTYFTIVTGNGSRSDSSVPTTSGVVLCFRIG